MSTRNVVIFFIGAFLGAIAFYFYNESREEGIFPESIKEVNASTADILRKNYSSAIPGDSIYGYNISLQELDGINQTIRTTLDSKLENISGFKLLKGLDEENPEATKSFLVYPIGKDLKIQKPGKVFKVWGFDDNYILPCPDFCDSPGPLPITFGQ